MGTEVESSAMPRGGHIPGLDGIRALAVGLVLFGHSVFFDEFTSLHAEGDAAAYAGVVLFFVLSGYLITTLLLREEGRTGGMSLKLFYIRRILRLFPALWLYLLVVAAIWATVGLFEHPWHSFVSSLLYLRNMVGRGHETHHLWSLSVEEQFYIIWPLLLLALPRRNRARLYLAVAALAGLTAWRIGAARLGLASIGSLHLRTDLRFGCPLFGCALALALEVAPWTVSRCVSTGTRSALLSLVGIAGVGAWVVFRLERVVGLGAADICICLLALPLILSQLGVQGRGSRWLAWRPFVAVGKISYGLYLWQQLFLGPQTPGVGQIRVFPFGLLATFAAATLSYWCLERPLLRLKDRFHKPGSQ
jgi:peptidoglycan/LPS O-acetylase OafA/YrhL